MARKCEAFTKSFHPCRGYADHKSGLCAKHTTWFSEHGWTKPFARKVRWNASTQTLTWARRVLSNPKTTFCWNEWATQLDMIWRSDAHTWYQQRTAAIIYELLCETGRIEPTTAVALWNHTIETWCGLLSDMLTTGRVDGYMLKHHQSFFLKNFFSNAPTAVLLGSFMALMPKLALNIPHTSLLTILDLAIDHVVGPTFSFNNLSKLFGLIEGGQAITKTLFPPTPAVDAFLGEVNAYFQFRTRERVLAVRVDMKSRCNIFKEELMMNRWHPDRVLKLLEAGIDVEEM